MVRLFLITSNVGGCFPATKVPENYTVTQNDNEKVRNSSVHHSFWPLENPRRLYELFTRIRQCMNMCDAVSRLKPGRRALCGVFPKRDHSRISW